MTAKELAQLLNGREYRSEITEEEELAAKESGLVVVYGASDDLVEICGAVYEERDAYNGTTLYITQEGVVEEPNGYDCEDCKFYQREMAHSQTIDAVWDGSGTGTPWTFETDIPHETFDIYEDDSLFCKGIIFAVADIKSRD